MPSLPDVERLRAELSYSPATGVISWKSHRKGVVPGRQVKCVSAQGYLVLGLDKRILLAHRVAWALEHGRWPENQIDHINRDKTDNRLSNLREATPLQNNANIGVCRRNTSGVKGVSWSAKRGKWVAQLRVGGVQLLNARFDCKELAGLVYAEAAYRAFGEFSESSSAA